MSSGSAPNKQRRRGEPSLSEARQEVTEDDRPFVRLSETKAGRLSVIAAVGTKIFSGTVKEISKTGRMAEIVRQIMIANGPGVHMAKEGEGTQETFALREAEREPLVEEMERVDTDHDGKLEAASIDEQVQQQKAKAAKKYVLDGGQVEMQKIDGRWKAIVDLGELS